VWFRVLWLGFGLAEYALLGNSCCLCPLCLCSTVGPKPTCSVRVSAWKGGFVLFFFFLFMMLFRGEMALEALVPLPGALARESEYIQTNGRCWKGRGSSYCLSFLKAHQTWWRLGRRKKIERGRKRGREENIKKEWGCRAAGIWQSNMYTRTINHIITRTHSNQSETKEPTDRWIKTQVCFFVSSMLQRA